MDQRVDNVIADGIEAAEMIVQSEGIIDERPCGGRQVSGRVERSGVLGRSNERPQCDDRRVIDDCGFVVELKWRDSGRGRKPTQSRSLKPRRPAKWTGSRYTAPM